jgi:multiple antibiotic resistance protein
MNSIGNCPTFLALLKDFSVQDQRRILFRETTFAFLLCIFFVFFGELLLHLLGVKNYTLTVAGGIILLLSSLEMIFSAGKSGPGSSLKQEPFIMPIATPLLAGGALLTNVILFTQQTSKTTVSLALIMAFIPAILITTSAPYLMKYCNRRGLIALEQLVGMVLLMIGADLLVKGFGAFIQSIR